MSDHKDGIDTGQSESLLGNSKNRSQVSPSTIDPEIVPELPGKKIAFIVF